MLVTDVPRQTAPAAGVASRIVLKTMHRFFMSPRPDWNSLGPYVPGWFRARLKRIDKRLVLQFMPPATQVPGGVNAALHPQGVWAICRRLPRSGLLYKRWIFSLSDEKGRYRGVTMDMIDMLRYSRNLWRRGQVGKLEEWFDRSIAALKQASRDKQRQQKLCEIAATMRRWNMTSGKPRVFWPGIQK